MNSPLWEKSEQNDTTSRLQRVSKRRCGHHSAVLAVGQHRCLRARTRQEAKATYCQSLGPVRVSILYSAVTSGSFLRAPPGPAGSGARGETTCQTRRNTWCLPEPLNLPQVDACSGNCRLTRSTGEHRVTVTTAVSVSGGGATAELQQRHRALKAKVTIEEK